MQTPLSIRKTTGDNGRVDGEMAVFAAPTDRANPHTKFRQVVEGWPGSGFARKITTLQARRCVDRKDGGEVVQIEIKIVTVFESGTSRTTLSSFSMIASEADVFIGAIIGGQVRDALAEVRHEITRLNQAAGETVFNPAATQALDGLIEKFGGAQPVESPGYRAMTPEELAEEDQRIADRLVREHGLEGALKTLRHRVAEPGDGASLFKGALAILEARAAS